jgi:hypothetical protein
VYKGVNLNGMRALGPSILRGRDLNPRPLGYEDYLVLSLLFRSIIYRTLVSPFLPLLARFCGVIVVRNQPKKNPRIA